MSKKVKQQLNGYRFIVEGVAYNVMAKDIDDATNKLNKLTSKKQNGKRD